MALVVTAADWAVLVLAAAAFLTVWVAAWLVVLAAWNAFRVWWLARSVVHAASCILAAAAAERLTS